MGNKYSLEKSDTGYRIRTEIYDFVYDKNKRLTTVYDNFGGGYYGVSQNVYGDIKLLECSKNSLSYRYDEERLKYFDSAGKVVNCDVKFIKVEKYKDFWLYEIANPTTGNTNSL